MPAVPRRFRWLVWVAWAALLVLAIVGHAGSLSRTLAHTEVDRAFSSLGLHWSEDSGSVMVTPVSPSARLAGIGEDSWLFKVDGKDIFEGSNPTAIARLLSGPDGGTVLLEVEDEEQDTSKVVQLVRSEASRDFVGKMQAPRGIVPLFDLLLALTLFGSSFILLHRRSDEPIAVFLSLAFACLGTSGSGVEDYWVASGVTGISELTTAFGLFLLFALIPAFPDGQYHPRWSFWLLVAAPFAAIAYVLDDEGLVLIGLLAVIPVSLWAVGRRYWRTGPGPERQQMKWGAFGFLGSLPLLIAGGAFYGLAELPNFSGTNAASWMTLAGTLLAYSSLLMIPIGVVLSLLRYRLNDADGAIGRSAGYATLTLFIGAIWAVGTSWANGFLTTQLGVNGTAVAPGVSALAAAAVFAPANKKILGWTERRFQGALIQLRSLPARLARLQHSDDPMKVADIALDAVVLGIKPDHAAIVGGRGEQRRVLAAHNVETSIFEGELETRQGSEQGSPFALVVPLTEGGAEVGHLMLGPRSDGAPYSRDERAALNEVSEPLGTIINVTSRRADRDAAIAQRIEAISENLARIQASLE